MAGYRFALVPDDDGADARYAHRVHGAYAFDTRRMGRVVAVGSDRGGPDGFELDYVQAELFIELTDEQATQWASGVRFDARIGNGSRPDQLGVNWLNEFQLGDRWRARAAAIGAVQLGDTAADGVLLNSRAGLYYDFDDGHTLALESFNSLGSTEDFGLSDRSQQLGPVLSGKAGDGWSWSVGNLFGLNEATPDNDFRFWLSRNF